MALIRSLFACAAVAYLSGCASRIPPNEYVRHAGPLAGVEACVAAGHMAPEVGGLGIAVLEQILRGYSYDAGKMAQEIEKSRDEVRRNPPSYALCHNTKSTIYAKAIELGIVGNAPQQRQLPVDPAPTNIPKTTWCNKLGQSVVCNTY